MKNNRTKSTLPQYSYRQNLKKEDVKVYKRIAVIFVGFLIVAAIIWFMATTFINMLGLLSNGNNSTDNTQTQTDNTPLQAPTIDKLPSATNKDAISVSGNSSPNVDINLTVNDKAVGTAKTDSSGSFQFESVPLTDGLNLIQVTATSSSGKTQSANTTVTLDKTKPSLALANPVDGTTYPTTTQTVSVAGTTEPNAKVYVNGSQSVVDSSGKFSYNLPVVAGENNIEVKASDNAGNVATTKIKVTVGP